MPDIPTRDGRGRATDAVHGGTSSNDYGAVNGAVYRSSTYEMATVEEGGDRIAELAAGRSGSYIYGRLGNPTNTALEHRLAVLEDAEAALVTASGMGAITTVFWTFLSSGDHVVADTTLYGDTQRLLSDGLTRFGVQVTFVDASDLNAVRAAMRPDTRVVYLETPCNPTLKINDIEAVAEIAHSQDPDVRVVVDNTFATPYLQNPLTLGADLVVHSMSKYLGGHSDLIGGCICGTVSDIMRLRYEGVQCLSGAVLAPDNAFLALRGIATLPLRMQQHCAGALTVAQHLDGCSLARVVHYPGLASHPGHGLASRQMRGFGGMVAVELDLEFERVVKFVEALRVFKLAVSLGGVESLVEHPASMTHSTLTAEQLATAGIAPGLVRLSIGIEDPADLVQDLDQALTGVH